MQGHEGHAGHDSGHANFRGGVAVDHAANGFDPHEIVRDFDWGKTSRVNGRVVREWELVALDKEIEVMPGVKFAAWTYNGGIPADAAASKTNEAEPATAPPKKKVSLCLSLLMSAFALPIPPAPLTGMPSQAYGTLRYRSQLLHL